MRVFVSLILLAIQLLAVYWWNDTELIGICTGAAILVLLTGGCHARR